VASDILSTVIEVEREIQERLDGEKKNSREWLERVKAETELTITREQERLAKAGEESLARAKEEAERRVEELLAKAELDADRISRITDELLRAVAGRYLPRVIPEP
jgi:vacuolar-type H+-ATPase subunit H